MVRHGAHPTCSSSRISPFSEGHPSAENENLWCIIESFLFLTVHSQPATTLHALYFLNASGTHHFPPPLLPPPWFLLAYIWQWSLSQLPASIPALSISFHYPPPHSFSTSQPRHQIADQNMPFLWRGKKKNVKWLSLALRIKFKILSWLAKAWWFNLCLFFLSHPYPSLPHSVIKLYWTSCSSLNASCFVSGPLHVCFH